MYQQYESRLQTLARGLRAVGREVPAELEAAIRAEGGVEIRPGGWLGQFRSPADVLVEGRRRVREAKGSIKTRPTPAKKRPTLADARRLLKETEDFLHELDRRQATQRKPTKTRRWVPIPKEIRRFAIRDVHNFGRLLGQVAAHEARHAVVQMARGYRLNKVAIRFEKTERHGWPHASITGGFAQAGRSYEDPVVNCAGSLAGQEPGMGRREDAFKEWLRSGDYKRIPSSVDIKAATRTARWILDRYSAGVHSLTSELVARGEIPGGEAEGIVLRALDPDRRRELEAAMQKRAA